MTLQQVLEAAVACHQSGQLDLAESIYRQILEQVPDQPDTLHLLGVLTTQRQQHDESIRLICRAIELYPGNADFYCSLGNAYLASRRMSAALEAYRQALARNPNHGNALQNLAVALHRLGDLEQACQVARQATEKLGTAEVFDLLGDIHFDRKEFPEALSAFRHTLALNPNLPDTHNSLANLLLMQEDYSAAECHYCQALAVNPHNGAVWSNLGMALREQGWLDESLKACQRAVRLSPGLGQALICLGVTCQALHRYDEAAHAFEQAIAAQKTAIEGYMNLAAIQLLQGRVAEAVATCELGLRYRPDAHTLHSTLLFSRIFLPGDNPQSLFEEQCRWGIRHASHMSYQVVPHENDRSLTRRLRIGYLSPNFREHCQCLFFLPLFAAHNRDHVEIYCYSDVKKPDARTGQIQAHADVWREVRRFSDTQLAEQIRSDRIDILVDTNMHLADGRPFIFARKPAPVQVCWLAYPGSTGLSAIDYRLSDALLDPPGLHDHLYLEKTIRLPTAFWCYDPLDTQTAVSPLPADTSGHITFGCLNNYCKVNEGVLRLWARVLRGVPGSRLVILSVEGSHRQRAIQFLQQEGIEPGRIEFVPVVPRGQYLERYHGIDIGLDTFPSNGHTTSLDALWMGVPVVTRVGDTVSGRAGLCQLTLLGLPELIAYTEEEYVRIATELSADRQRLAELRSTLRERLRRSPLMDARRFASGMESAFRIMWARWCEPGVTGKTNSVTAQDASKFRPSIPRRIHQQWKSTDLPPRYAAFARQWQQLHPNWEYRLWTDEEIRKLVTERYPEFLSIYDGYTRAICRADLARYLILNEFGGVYADLDCECLKPLDDLLGTGGFVIAHEPESHAKAEIARSKNLLKIPGNAFMASEPGHPVWQAILAGVRDCALFPGPLDATGPFLLARVLNDSAVAAQVTFLSAGLIYCMTREECFEGTAYDLEFWAQRTRDAYVLHHWDGTWFDHVRSRTGLPRQFPVTIHNPQFPERVHGGTPKVSCIMTTRGRVEYVRRSLACFLSQSYPHRELVIVTPLPDAELEALVSAHGQQPVRLIIHTDAKASLGELRNVALEAAEGELIAVWDDDDIYDPDRLTVQVESMIEAGATACVLERLVLWSPQHERLGISTRRAWEGSLLAVRAEMPRYANLFRGEDTPVIIQLMQTVRTIIIDLPRLYTYQIHDRNTTTDQQFETWWKTATAIYTGSTYHATLRELQRRWPVSIENPGASRADSALRVHSSKTLEPSVLILTPVKNAANLLPRYFRNLHQLDYPLSRISLGLLESDSSDGTKEWLSRHFREQTVRFASASYTSRDFQLQPRVSRGEPDVQFPRRSILARCRNLLLSRYLKDHDWVFWLDAGVISYPPDTLRRLIESGDNIVTPHCVLHSNGVSFDRNTFCFRPGAEASEREHHMVDGLVQPPGRTERIYLDSLRHLPRVEVHSVGATMLLVNADYHREGLNFPAHSYRGYIESEGLAMIARDLGYRCIALPQLIVEHANDSDEFVLTLSCAPLVTCMMVTRGRGKFARNAIECFLSQSYDNRELLIVTEQLDSTLAEFLSQLSDSRIRVHTTGDVGLTLGELRNLALEHARGELVCQWDDDDLYHPDRLRVQVLALQEAGADACLLERWTIHWHGQQRLAESCYRDWEGSLLARRARMPRYPAMRRGEDTPVVDTLREQARIVRLDRPDLYIYTVHGDNTFPDHHFHALWQTATQRFEGDEFQQHWQALTRRLPPALSLD